MFRGQKGQTITLVDKGIVRSSYDKHTWIDESRRGRTVFLVITRVGRKYIYGKPKYFDGAEGWETSFESDFLIDDYTTYDGIREDLKSNHQLFLSQLADYEKLRADAVRNVERQMQEKVREEMAKWEAEHPRPFQKLEAKEGFY